MKYINHRINLSQDQKVELIRLNKEFSNTLYEKTVDKGPYNRLISYLKIVNAEVFKNALHDKIEDDVNIHLIHEDGEILSLPWQILFEEKPLVHISKGHYPLEGSMQHVHWPLKVLLFMANPTNSRQLNTTDELKSILSAFSSIPGSKLNLDVVADGSLLALEHSISKKDYDIIYFSCHGKYEGGQTILTVEEPLTAEKSLVFGNELASLIKKSSGKLPSVCMFSSCDTAKGITVEGYKGITQELLDLGVDCVISFGYEIEQTFAADFFFYFTHNLVAGYDLLRAFEHSALAINYSNTSNLNTSKKWASYQWFFPQVFLRKQTTRIIPRDEKVVPAKDVKQTLFESKAYYPFVHRKEIVQIANALKSNSKIQLSGHSMIGKTQCLKYCAESYDNLFGKLENINFVHQEFSWSELAKQTQELIGGSYTDDANFLKKRLEEYASDNQLLISVLHIEAYLELNEIGFVLQNEQQTLLDYLLSLTGISVVVVCRHPLSSASFDENIIFKDASIPIISLILKKHFLGCYIEEHFSKRKEVSYYSNSPLDYLVKRLFSGDNFGGILGLYALLEVFVMHQRKQVQFVHENDFIREYDQTISTVLNLYSNGHEKFGIRGYNIETFIQKLPIEKKRLVAAIAFLELPAKKEALLAQPDITRQDLHQLSWLVECHFIEQFEENLDYKKDKKGKYILTSLFYIHPLLNIIKLYFDTTIFSRRCAGKYFLSYFEHYPRLTISEQLKSLELAYTHFDESDDIEGFKNTSLHICYLFDHVNKMNDVKRYAEHIYEKLGDQCPAEIFRYLFSATFENDFSSAIKYNELMITAAEREKDTGALIHVKRQEGIIYQLKGDFETANNKFNEALELDRLNVNKNDPWRHKLGIYNDSIYSLRMLDQLEEAKRRIMECITAANKGGWDSSVHHNNLAELYLETGRPEKAIIQIQKAINESRKYKNFRSEIAALLSKAVYYKMDQKFDSAKEELLHALTRTQAFHDVYRENHILNELGLVCLREAAARGRTKGYPILNKALSFFLRALQFYEENGWVRHECSVLISLYRCYEQQFKIDEAIYQLQKGLLIAKQHRFQDIEVQALLNLTAVYARNDFDNEAEQCLKEALESIDLQLDRSSSDQYHFNNLLSNKLYAFFMMAEVHHERQSEYLEYMHKGLVLFFEKSLIIRGLKAELQFYMSVRKYSDMYPEQIYVDMLTPYIDELADKYEEEYQNGISSILDNRYFIELDYSSEIL